MKKLILIATALLPLATFAQVVRPLSVTRVQAITLDTITSNHIASNTAAITTISSGEWNGTVIAGQYGGTGVANTGKTITLGHNLITAGAYALTLTQTNTTNVTLPTTGTLATLAGAEALSNKTSINLVEITAPAHGAELELSDYSKLTLTGGDTVALTTSANTTLTLPTTGTLATLAGAEAFTNKLSYNKVKITAPSTGAELALSDLSKLALTGGDTLTFTTSANSSLTLPTTGTLMTLGGAETVTGVKKFTGHNLYYGEILTATDTLALAADTHYTVLADATSSAILLTLPAAASSEGAIIRVKCINADAEVKIITAGGTIDATAGATGITLSVWDGREFMSNGTNWYIITKF
ncbi:MAG: hypothetical protein WC359_13415 [Dehalococcoidia bacterium]|jgi:hypothetical protein